MHLNGIEITLQWDGEKFTVVLVKRLTDEQYESLKVSPNALTYSVMKKAGEGILKARRIEIEEVDK